MGRQLAGPVRIGKSKTWYARVTVAPKDRDRAGCVRLTRSLKTTDKATALKRWPLVHKQLQQELDLRLGLPVTDRDQLRSRIEEVRNEETFQSQAADGSTQEEPYTPTEKAEAVLNVIGLEEDNPLHEEVFKAIRDGGKVTTWESLRETYAKRFLKRKGRKPSAETLLKIDRSVALFRTCCPYPSLITKTICRDFIANLEGLEQYKPSTISDFCAGVSKLITAGIKTDELPLEVNPWAQIDWAAATLEDDGYRNFELKRELPKLMGSEYWEIFRLFLGTGLRYGEAFNRSADDLEGNILVIRHNTDAEWRTKTSSSVRRVPLDDRAVRAFKAILQRNLRPPTWNQYLNREIRRFFDDPRLVLHSTRHTYKTLCRVTGVEINIGEEISGHAKSRVSKTSDGYGEYPDEVLIKENSKVWQWLDAI